MPNIIEVFIYTFEELKNAYASYGTMKKAGESLGLSKDQFRQQFLVSQNKCIKCQNELNKSGMICSVCLEKSRNKTKENLPKFKNCSQCSCEMSRKEEQSNISWAKQNTCDDCEYQNKLNYSKSHYEMNKQEYLAREKLRKDYHKEYRKSPIGKLKKQVSNAKRRAQKFNTQTDNINKEIEELFSTTKLCYYCELPKKLTVEHKTPLCRGGMHTIDNIVLACISCNSSKGSKTEEEFIQYKKKA